MTAVIDALCPVLQALQAGDDCSDSLQKQVLMSETQLKMSNAGSSGKHARLVAPLCWYERENVNGADMYSLLL